MERKKSASLLLAFGIFLLGIVTVSAAYGTLFEFTLPANGGQFNGPVVKPTSNFVWATSHVNSSKNGDKYDTYYQTSYNGSWVTIGSSLTLKAAGNTGNAVWYPTSKSNANGSPYSATVSTKCSGGNTSSTYCAIAQSQYRLSFKNGSLLGGTTTVKTLFTLD